ncbi:MAG: hypothetical protein QM689_09480 [Oscillospiraceae bacterium]
MDGWVGVIAAGIAFLVTAAGGAVLFPRDSGARAQRIDGAQTGKTPPPAGILLFAGVVCGACAGLSACAYAGQTAFDDPTNAALAGCAVFTAALFAMGTYEDMTLYRRCANFVFAPRVTIAAQAGLTVSLLVWLKTNGAVSTAVLLPFQMGYAELGWLFYPLTTGAVLIIIGGARSFSEAQGTGIVTFLTAAAGLAAAAQLIGNTQISTVALALGGAALGFLPVNFPPAGALAGRGGAGFFAGAICGLCLMSGKAFLLLLCGGVLLIEKLTEALSVASYRLRGKNLLKERLLHRQLLEQTENANRVILLYLSAGAVFALAAAAFAEFTRRVL